MKYSTLTPKQKRIVKIEFASFISAIALGTFYLVEILRAIVG